MVTRVPYYAPSPCHMHPGHNCHHIKSCHPPDKQYTEFIIYTCSLFFICNNKVSTATAVLWDGLWIYCILASALLRIPPLLPPFLAQSLLRSLPPFRRSCPVPSSLVPFINPPSLNPPFLHWRSLPAYRHRFLPPSPCSLPPSPCSPLPYHPLAPSLPASLPPLDPSLISPHPPLLSPSHPPSFLAPCLPPSLPAYLPPSNSMYTVSVCFGPMHCIV